MRSGTGRGAAIAAAAGACVALLAGCGIRTTSVPVDAGAAPSRAACSVDGPGTAAQPRPGIPLRVYLVCGSQLEAVDRTTNVPEQKVSGDRVKTASALLMELQSETSDAERTAGFSTAVKGPLVVTGGRRDDPKGALRLSRQPEDLAPTALAQIVCTFAESAAGSGGGTVVLGGPGDYAAHRYRCTAELKDRPDMAVPTVTPTGSPTS
ncbi:hypothetical protein [Streptomyces solicathayae]|uniref:Lipoprotein n=1 Tax=Streptomyces solicathayae TaxID=3081768 RepID=A0ABZ0LUQ3_9ACTN|nr:hypothetical protein [Streptomyces sp. HUAS YS2]WOX22499.1 hypothetical protein R2D22_14270 [Streptomyces sp. HUAS YS2]